MMIKELMPEAGEGDLKYFQVGANGGGALILLKLDTHGAMRWAGVLEVYVKIESKGRHTA